MPFAKVLLSGGPSAVPARGATHSAPGRLRQPIGRHNDWPVRSSLHWRRGGSSRSHPVIPGNAEPELSQEVKALASAAVERREASAPEAHGGGNVAPAWRAPRPKRRQAVTLGGVARL